MAAISNILHLLSESDEPAADQTLACGLLMVDGRTQDQLIEILLERDRDEGLAALVERFHLLGEEQQLKVVAHTSQFFGALRATIRSPDVQTRFNSMEMIQRSENPRLAYLAAASVSDGATHIRAEAAKTLRGLTHRHCRTFWETTATLREAVSSTDDPAVSHSIVATLRLLRDERQHLLAALRDALKSFESHHRAEVLEAAMYMPDELEAGLFQEGTLKRGKLTQAMLEIFNENLVPQLAPFAYIALCYSELRKRVVGVLATLKSPEFFTEFIRFHWLAHDPAIRRNLAAIRSLDWLGDGMHAAFSLPADVAPLVPAWLMHLGLSSEAKVAILRQFLLIENKAANRAALWALVRMELPASTSVLTELSDHEDPGIRRIAEAELTHRRRTVRRIPALVQRRAGNENRPEGWSQLLERGALREDFEDLWQHFERIDPRMAARYGHYALKYVPGFLTQAQVRLLSPHAIDRLRGVRFIATLNVAAALANDICNMANDPSAEVRAGAIVALGKVNTASVRRILVRALRDEAPAVQVAAIDALENLGDSRRAELVLPNVDHEDAMVRASSIRVLLRMRMVDGARSLLTMLNDPRFEHRCSALWVVEQLSLMPLMSRVAELARDDPDPRVARVAQHVGRRLERRIATKSGPRSVTELPDQETSETPQ